MPKIGKVFHPQYLLHDPGAYHPESPGRLRSILKMLQETQIDAHLLSIAPRKATADEIEGVHSQDYLEEVQKTADRGGVYLDADTFASSESYEAALLAAGGLLEAVAQVYEGELDQAFALLRPPGHHAERDHAMGFCFFNNVAIAAQFLIQKYHLKRVAIVDYDVHHGNATQHMFEDRDDVFFMSTHRYPFYPGTGAASEIGRGAGRGYTLNLPMQGGARDLDYQKVFEEKLLPALRDYQPQMILVSAGFDAHVRDPLGGMRVTEQGFAWMSEQIQKVAQDLCQGKVVYTLEGGYDFEGLAKSVEAVFKVLLKP